MTKSIISLISIAMIAIVIISCNDKTTQPERTVATPDFEPIEGTYSSSLSVTISCETDEATIRYTTDLSNPTESSTAYSEPIVINQSTTLKAIAFKADWKNSEMTAAVYIITVPDTVAAPIFVPAGGEYDSVQNVSITSETEDTIIRYTTDGQDPTEESELYTEPVEVAESLTLKAVAYKEGWIASEITTEEYIINRRVALPEFDPPAGNYYDIQNVTINSATDGAVLRYTTDGQAPTEDSPIYTDTIEVSRNTVIKAFASKEGYFNSETAVAEYVLTVATPTMNPSGGNYDIAQDVELDCVTENAVIRYTTNSFDPIEFSPIYEKPIKTSDEMTIKAKAFRDGWNSSSIAEETYTLEGMPPFPEMIFVQGATFTPRARYIVNLSSYYIGKYEVTQQEYEEIMGINPSHFSGYPNRPVEKVSWFNAVEYCNRLSVVHGYTPAYSYGSYGTNPDDWPAMWWNNDNNHLLVNCNWSADGYRLPTAMEWEFAARGGIPAQNGGTFHTPFSGSSNIDEVAWYQENSDGRSHDVGTKLPNELNIHDLSGNVWAWCWDIYGEYPEGTYTDPSGVDSGQFRTIRGGSWSHASGNCQTNFSMFSFPIVYYGVIGLRVVRRDF